MAAATEHIDAKTGLTPEQLEEIRTAFDAYDENGDGVLTLEEIAGVMYKLGQVPSIPELRSMFREVDVDGDSTITFVEFCQLMAPRLNKPQFSDESLTKVFKKFDKDKSGSISISELQQAFEMLGVKHTDAEMQDLFALADDNGDGLISFDEFRAMFLSEAKKPTRLTAASKSWSRLKSVVSFTSLWKPRPTDPEKIKQAREEAEKKGKVLKEVTFIRHGESQANEAFRLYHKDMFIWEPTLTELGFSQAKAAGDKMKEDKLKFELIVVSPLRRAIQTAHTALDYYIKGGVPVVGHPDATEQVTGSDDIGSSPDTLRKEWPNVDWNLMPHRDVWWWVPEDKLPKDRPATVDEIKTVYQADPWEEPWPSVVKRAAALEAWLASRSENKVCVVAHGDLLEAMTGKGLSNAQSFLMEVDAATAGTASQ